MRTVARLALAAALALAGVVAPAQPALAQADTGWVIERFDVRVTVRDDGVLSVSEDIELDFDGLDRHGIYRVLPVRYAIPGDTANWRIVEVEDIVVRATAPDGIEVTRPDPWGRETDLVVRIGDPDRTVSGRQRYQISYRVRGALNAFGSHTELYWNATGNGWPVPIQWARVQVRGGQILKGTCFRGPVGSTSLCEDTGVLVGEYPAWASARDLGPGEGLTIVTAFAPDTVAAGTPLIVPRWTLARALAGSPWAVPLTLFVALLVGALVLRLLWREGRDRWARGGVSAAGIAEHDPPRRPLLGRHPLVPEFRPPEDVRPALLGLLVDERVDPVDVSATVVDLAVRGHLRIEERRVDRPMWFSSTEWVLHRLPGDEADLRPYERRLLDALFSSGDEVELSSLKGSFAGEYRQVCGDIEQAAVARGWFRRRPSHVRTAWLAAGLVALGLSVALTVVAALFTTVALAVLPLFVASLAVVVAHRWMPARTAEGSRLLARALGFREFIRAAETDRMAFAERERMFVDYLPFAMVFGAVDHWAQVFQSLGLDVAAATSGWYAGHWGGGGPDLARMSSGLSDFSRTVGTVLPVAPASSGGSGFGGGSSGGGFGGGGGGSW